MTAMLLITLRTDVFSFIYSFKNEDLYILLKMQLLNSSILLL